MKYNDKEYKQRITLKTRWCKVITAVCMLRQYGNALRQNASKLNLASFIFSWDRLHFATLHNRQTVMALFKNKQNKIRLFCHVDKVMPLQHLSHMWYELTCTIFFVIAQVNIHLTVELQKRVPLVSGDAGLTAWPQKLQEIFQVGSSIFVQHNR